MAAASASRKTFYFIKRYFKNAHGEKRKGRETFPYNIHLRSRIEPGRGLLYNFANASEITRWHMATVICCTLLLSRESNNADTLANKPDNAFYVFTIGTNKTYYYPAGAGAHVCRSGHPFARSPGNHGRFFISDRGENTSRGCDDDFTRHVAYQPPRVSAFNVAADSTRERSRRKNIKAVVTAGNCPGNPTAIAVAISFVRAFFPRTKA